MNTTQAKAESLLEFFARLGYQPAYIRGNDVWYRSPYRPDERTPSFKIDRAKNVWYDHGIGKGGTIIDFIGELHSTSDISYILTVIADTLGQPVKSVIALPHDKPIDRAQPIIDRIDRISDKKLEEYLKQRAIPVDLARLYLNEVGYRVGEKQFLALAFPNVSGGLEVRSPNFKGSLGTKDISLIGRNVTKTCAVFEGFFDFLSTLNYYKQDHVDGRVLVLNSVALVERGMEKLLEQETNLVHAYFDHDDAGENALALFRDMPMWRLHDASDFYRDYKDVNEFLVAYMKQQA